MQTGANVSTKDRGGAKGAREGYLKGLKGFSWVLGRIERGQTGLSGGGGGGGGVGCREGLWGALGFRGGGF